MMLIVKILPFLNRYFYTCLTSKCTTVGACIAHPYKRYFSKGRMGANWG
ncbi:hypothetical protein [Moraxella lacunata]